MPSLNRRTVLRGLGATVGFATLSPVVAPCAQAQTTPRVLGKVIDYSAGVPSASAVKNAGYIGAVRYVSQPRPEAKSWMRGKPVSLSETKDFARLGLATASVYQFGRANSADWLQGAAGAATHAPQAIALHTAAGGPRNKPIYVAIDDNPSRSQYVNQIRPYLTAFKMALEAAGLKLGVYGNYSTIQWALQDGLGEYFWQHNWGSQGRVHPRANIHQVKLNATSVGGVVVDINYIYTSDWGQWNPIPAAQAPHTVTEPEPSAKPTGTGDGGFIPAGSSIPDVNLGSSTVDGEQIRNGLNLAADLYKKFS